MSQPCLETQRLILRPLTPEDAPRIETLAGNWAVARSTLNIPHPYTDGLALAWLSGLEQTWDAGTGAAFGVVTRTDQALIGVVSLVSIIEQTASIGYWLGEPYWGKGYCTEATRRLIRFAHEHFGITHLLAEHLANNPASGRVMAKAGMTHWRSTERPDRFGKPARLEVYQLRFPASD